MSVAPAAPAAPALAYLVVGLLLMLAWAVQRGLLAIWLHTFGAMLIRLSQLLTIDISFVHIHLGGPLLRLNDVVRNALVAGAEKAEHGAGYFFHGCAVIVRWMAGEIEDLAGETYGWAEWFQKAHLPRLLKAAIYAAFPPLLIARLVKAAIHANLPHVGRVVTTKTTKVVTHTVTKIIHATTGAVAIPRPGLHVLPRLRDLEHELLTTRARLRKIGWVGAFASAAGLVAIGMKRLGLNCLLGRNGRAIGKQLCRFDADLLNALLLGGLAITTLSVVEFAKDLQALEDVIIGHLSRIVREFPDPKALQLTGTTWPH